MINKEDFLKRVIELKDTGCINNNIKIWDEINKINIKEGTIPLVVFKKNHHEPYVSLPMEHFIELLKIVKNIAVGEKINEN